MNDKLSFALPAKDLAYLLVHPNAVEIAVLLLSKFEKVPKVVGFAAVADLDYCRVVYSGGRYVIRGKGTGIVEETTDFANVVAFIASKWW